MNNQLALLALPRFMTIPQAADYLGVSRTTVMGLMDTGTLRTWRLESGRRKIDRDSIAKLVGLSC